MACATLKRPLEMDPLCSRPTKRRRYGQISAPATPSRDEEPSPFAEVTAKMCPLSLDNISVSIKDEMKRLHRRKQLHMGSDREGSSSPNGPSSPSDASIDQPGSPQSSHHNKNDKHLFTFRQVGMICERLLKERDDSLKELYDQILHTKLAEQYDTFVKFTYDQIQKRFDSSAAPSYLS